MDSLSEKVQNKYFSSKSIDFSECEISELKLLTKSYQVEKYVKPGVILLTTFCCKALIIKLPDEWYIVNSDYGIYLCDQFYSVCDLITNELTSLFA